MQHVIIVVHLMVVTALVALVLYQKSEGGALGMGQSGLFTGRGQANALTRATSILGTIFFLTSVALTVLPAWERRSKGEDWTTAVDQPKVEFKDIPSSSAPAPAADAAKDKPAGDAKESIFDQLKRAQEKRGAASQPSPGPAGSATTPSAPVAAPVETPKAAAPAATTPATPTLATPPLATPVGKPNAAAPASEAERPALRPTTQDIPAHEAPAQAPTAEPAPAEPAKPAGEMKAPAREPAPAPPTIWKAPTQ